MGVGKVGEVGVRARDGERTGRIDLLVLALWLGWSIGWRWVAVGGLVRLMFLNWRMVG